MRVNTAVNDRHANTRAIPPGLPGHVGADGLGGDIQSAGQTAVGRDISDQWINLERPDFGRRQPKMESPYMPEAAYDLI